MFQLCYCRQNQADVMLRGRVGSEMCIRGSVLSAGGGSWPWLALIVMSPPAVITVPATTSLLTLVTAVADASKSVTALSPIHL